MAFPVSPIDGQSAVLNNVLYTYTASKGTWTRVPGNTILGGVSLAQSNVIFEAANSAGSYANAAFAAANSGSSATGAFNQANAAFERANSSLSTTGGTVSGDLSVTGNLFVQGNSTTVSSNNVVLNDTLLYIANNNPANLNEIGFVGHFTSDTYQHTGLVRDHADNKWKLFSNVAEPGQTTVSFTGAVYDTLKVGTIEATTTNIGGVDVVTFAGSAFNQANAAFNYANTQIAVGTGVDLTQNTNITNAGAYANAAFTAANSSGSYANAAFVQANTAINNAAGASNYANSAFAAANAAGSSATVTAAFATANSKSQVWYQNTTPSTANTGDMWLHKDTGFSYENFGNTTHPIWAEAGPSGPLSNIAVISASSVITSTLAAGNTTITYAPATAVGAALTISAANTLGGTSYADLLKFTNTSGGTTNPSKTIRMNNIGALEIINDAYSSSLLLIQDNGDTIFGGNVTINGINSGYAPNRPAFCVRGSGGQVTAPATLTNSNWTIEFNQGSYLNGTTGIFTAPVAGLYQVNLLIRTSTNSSGSIIQALVRKTAAIGGATSTIIMVEFGPNTSMNHAGGSSLVKLAVGDTLQTVASAGTISFDGNDNWSVAYIG